MAKNRVLSFALFFVSLFSFCHASSDAPICYFEEWDIAAYFHEYVDCFPFEGDCHGDFAGDPVAVLEDGSAWKVHPKHAELFLTWAPGQTVHVAFRTSHYFFKREHKFALINHDLGQEVFVMMVDSPLSVLESGPDQPSTIVTNYVGYSSYTTYEDFKKNICLLDGSLWEIESHLKADEPYFEVGSPAYVGFNLESGSYEEPETVKFFLIDGLQREGFMSFARPGNYFYVD